MKGIVFTELLEKVESKFGCDMVDENVKNAQDMRDGADTSVNTYSHNQIFHNVLKLIYESHRSMNSVVEGLILGCRYCFGRRLNIVQESSSADGQKVVFIISRS